MSSSLQIASLFLDDLEKCLFPLPKEMIIFKRYVDDGFLIWNEKNQS